MTPGSVPEHGLYDPFTGSATLPPALPIRAYFPHQLLPSCAWGAQHPEGRTLWVQSSTQNHGTHLPAASTSPKIHTWAFFLLSPPGLFVPHRNEAIKMCMRDYPNPSKYSSSFPRGTLTFTAHAPPACPSPAAALWVWGCSNTWGQALFFPLSSFSVTFPPARKGGTRTGGSQQRHREPRCFWGP